MKVTIKHDAAQRVRRGFPWVFSHDVAGSTDKLPRGGAVTLCDAKGAVIAHGFANPEARVAVRVASWRPKEDIAHPIFLGGRVREAIARRTRACVDARDIRLVHGEADGVPGLWADRLGSVVRVQRHAPWLDGLDDALVEVLLELDGVTTVIADDNGPMVAREGMIEGQRVLAGDVPEEVEYQLAPGVLGRAVVDRGERFVPDPALREAREQFAKRCKGARVLDVYAGPGAFALCALAAGAQSVLAVDKYDENAAVACAAAASLGGEDRFEFWAAPVLEGLGQLVSEGRRFDAILVDPPAFAKTRNDVKQATEAYRGLLGSLIPLLVPDGLILATTRSFPIDADTFSKGVSEAVAKMGRVARSIAPVAQGGDMPGLYGFTQGEIVKGGVWQVSMS